jgi:hypothetical protein
LSARGVFGARFSTEIYFRDAIGFPRPCSLEVSRCVTNGIPLGCPLILTVAIVNYAQTLKANLPLCDAERDRGTV